MANLPEKYVKWIFLAVVLAAISQTITVYSFKTIEELRNEMHVMDKQMAVLEERMHYIDGQGITNNSLAHSRR